MAINPASPTTFDGKLFSNEIFAGTFNVIARMAVANESVSNVQSTLYDMAKVDIGMYGDSIVRVSTDVANTYDWLGDAEAQNLLKVHRPIPPKEERTAVDEFRFVPLTIDYTLSKRMFADEGSFSKFTNQLLAWMSTTKRIYSATRFNAFIGTHQAGLSPDGKGAKQNITIALPAEPDGADDYNTEAYNRLWAQTVATEVADLLVNLTDISRDYNDFGQLRAEDPDNLIFVWNSEVVNRIKKLDVPTIFNNQGLIDKFAQHVLPARYFGKVNTSGGTTSGTNITIRSLIEKDYNTVERDQTGYDPAKHIFPGDLLPPNTAYEADETYTQDSSILFKVYHKDAVPAAGSFEIGTNFYNPRALNETSFIIFSQNPLGNWHDLPFITAKGVPAA